MKLVDVEYTFDRNKIIFYFTAEGRVDFRDLVKDLTSHFNAQIRDSRFKFLPSQGTYFQNLDYSEIRPDLNDVEMCQFLAEQHKIVAIPISVFYQQPPESLRLIRFCFAKTDITLQRAGEILVQC